ncbi:MAG: hypothetical protein NZM13_08305 [Cyclobacteriaceae bacterium]|nr:hypothetical protein [Cyclobacteriaceae bacterium]MDW8330537.1 hypothetical protein [Cyclobacteriaceae bacterium]
MRRFFPVLFFSIALTGDLLAQCAMCRSTLENNVSQGEPGIAAGINTGILYLLAFPYLAALVIGYFWYRNSRKTQINSV